MEVTGTIINILPLQSGTAKTGNEWKRQDIIIQTEENYPKTICLSLWGDLINETPKQGSKARFHFNLESREFNGKWYTDVRAWKIEQLNNLEEKPVLLPNSAVEVFDNTNGDILPF